MFLRQLLWWSTVSCCLFAVILSRSQWAHAAPTLSTDNGTTIGTMTAPKNYGATFGAFWKAGAPDYTMLATPADTYINVPNAGGTIHFRSANAGYPGQADLVTIEGSGEVDVNSDGNYALACLTAGDGGIGIQGDGHLYGVSGFARQSEGAGVQGLALDAAKVGVYGASNPILGGYGVRGVAIGGWPSAGVYGSNDTTGGTAVVGIAASTTSSMGIFGQGATTGVQGVATAGANGSTVPWGVSGVAGGSGGHAIDAICNYACASSATSATSPGLAGHFVGNVQIEGTNSTMGSAPFALSLKTGDAAKPSGGMWTNATSDERTKKEVTAFKEGLAEVLRVQPVKYKYNGLAGTQDDGVEFVGVIAQQLEKVSPSMITWRRAKLRESDATETDIRGVNPSNFTYMLINAVKDQNALIVRQEARIAALERGRAPLASSFLSGGGIAAGVAIGLVPLGFVVAVGGRRKKRLRS